MIIHTFIDHLSSVNTVKFSPDGTCISSGSEDKKVKVYDVRSGRVIIHFDAHSAGVTDVSYHPSGKYLISSSLDGTMKIWDLVQAQILYTVHGHNGGIYSVDFARDGDYFCSGGEDGVLMIWKSNVTGMGLIEKNELIGKKNVNSNNNNNSNSSVNPSYRLYKTKINTSGNCTRQTKKIGEETKTNKLSNTNFNFTNTNINNNNNITKNINNNVINNNNNILNNSQISRSSNGSSVMTKLPEELTNTFEKMINQLDLVAKTMKIMDTRLQNLENNVGVLYNRTKKGFILPGNDESHLMLTGEVEIFMIVKEAIIIIL
jgi:centriolar protein POC1